MKQLNNQLSAKSKRLLLLSFLLALLPTTVSAQCPDDNHPHMIDLGLPSGTKWACCNVDAEKPEDYGGYYAWGEVNEWGNITGSKNDYSWKTYAYCDGSEEGCSFLGSDIAKTNWDVAHVKWRGTWMMPTVEQCNELIGNCSSEWTSKESVYGYSFVGPNGNSIFMPAAGYRDGESLYCAGTSGIYWTSTLLETKYAEGYYFNSGNVERDGNPRCVGRSVRPVAPAGSSSISFADPAVKAICVANWDTNGDGELSYDEAAAVTELGTVFNDNQEITSFNELQYFTSLKEISNNAFGTCYSLNAVTIPQSVTHIGNFAFRYCNKLKSIIIPKSVTSIGLQSFDHCISLTSIRIPNSVTSLYDNPFEFCRVLTSIEVEEGNPVFDSREGCNAIIRTEDNTLVTGCFGTVIPNNVTSIGRAAFSGCQNLGSITIPNNVTAIDEWAFSHCYALNSVSISNNVETIGWEAFATCKSLTSIILPKSVIAIGRDAFYGCDNLKKIVSLIEDPFEIDEGTFTLISGAFTTATLSVPVGCKSKYEATPAWNKFQSIVEESASSGITIDATNFPDDNFRNWVLAQDYGQDGVLTDAEIATVSIIAVGSKNISDLKGIEFFTALKYLYCEYNELTSLDVSKNTLLIQLNCYGNQLTSLDFSKNVVLERLLCSSNQLTSLDVSQNKALNYLSCYYNQLTTLDVSQNKALTDLDCQENPLTSLDLSKNTALESLSFSEVLLSSIDLSHNTALTDLSFRNTPLTSIDLSNNRALTTLSCINNDQLTSLDVTKNTALTTLTCMSNDQLTSIDVTKNTALTRLYCDRNQLTSLDVSKNVALESLNCYSNQLTSLDVSKNTALTALNCGANPMTTIDVSKNVALNNLSCSDNQLTSLDVSKNIALTNLYCDNNQLSSLDVSKNTALIVLSCDGNQLSSLDVSKNTALIQFNCHDNQLTSLDLSQNASLQVLTCYYNQLRGTAMDALIESLPESEGYFYAFVPFDSKEQNVVTKAQVAAAKEKRWTTFYYDDNYGWKEYEGSEQGMDPIGNGETIDIGNEIDENTNLEGTVVDNVFVNISNGNGGFDPAEGCLIVSKPTDDSAINGKDIFGDDFKDNYTGIVFKVNEGKGSIKVEAETQGNMVLKVKIGNSEPIEMELDGKQKVKFPYNVSEETLVYIYGGMSTAGAKATGGTRASADADLLKIYGFEIVSDASGIEAAESGLPTDEDAPVYNLNGQRVDTPTKGIYIKNGRKVLMK